MMMMMMMMMMILRRLHCLSGFYFFVNLWSLFTNVVSDFVSDTERLSESRWHKKSCDIQKWYKQ